MTSTSLGAQWADAVARKDAAAVLDLLHPELDFHAMTPRRTWDAESPSDVVTTLHTWFGDDAVIEDVERVQTDSFADRERVGYRLRVRNGDGLHLVEQQAYLSEKDGRIGWLRVMCAGYRPIDG